MLRDADTAIKALGVKIGQNEIIGVAFWDVPALGFDIGTDENGFGKPRRINWRGPPKPGTITLTAVLTRGGRGEFACYVGLGPAVWVATAGAKVPRVMASHWFVFPPDVEYRE